MLLTILRSIQVVGMIMMIGGFLLGFTSEEEVVIFGLKSDRFSGIGMTITAIALLAFNRLNKKPDDIPMGNRSDFE